MRKAKMSFQSGQVKQVIRTYAVEIQTSDKRELEADVVTMKLRKAMGANCKSISDTQSPLSQSGHSRAIADLIYGVGTPSSHPLFL